VVGRPCPCPHASATGRTRSILVPASPGDAVARGPDGNVDKKPADRGSGGGRAAFGAVAARRGGRRAGVDRVWRGAGLTHERQHWALRVRDVGGGSSGSCAVELMNESGRDAAGAQTWCLVQRRAGLRGRRRREAPQKRA